MVAIPRDLGFLYTTMPLTLTKRFPSGPTVSDALTILHDADAVLRLNPLLLTATLGADGWYEATEALPLFGGILEGKSNYRFKWTNEADGGKADIEASLGTKVGSRMTVKNEGGVVVLTDSIEIKALIPLASFIKDTLVKAREDAHDILIQRVLEKMNKRDEDLD